MTIVCFIGSNASSTEGVTVDMNCIYFSICICIAVFCGRHNRISSISTFFFFTMLMMMTADSTHNHTLFVQLKLAKSFVCQLNAFHASIWSMKWNVRTNEKSVVMCFHHYLKQVLGINATSMEIFATYN